MISVEVKKPIKDPKAAFVAVLVSDSFKSSPIRAPTKGPIMIPPGIGAIRPIISPIKVPIIPYLVPPNRLVPSAGMI